MSRREGHGQPVRGGKYSHWGQDDSGRSGAPFGPPVEPSPNGAVPTSRYRLGDSEAGEQPEPGRESYTAEEVRRAPLRAKATATKTPGPNDQLKVMSMALSEVKAFIDELASLNLGAVLQGTQQQVDAAKYKANLIAVLRLLTQPGSVADRAGGLTEEEDLVVMKAVMTLTEKVSPNV
jgi:hypothetical protein